MDRHLFNTEKIRYVKGKKPDVTCILCAIRDKNPEVAVLEVFRTEKFIASVNLYPYNPGHLMIFPLRHVEDFRELSGDEVSDLHRITSKMITVIEEEFNPLGFNIGFNLGKESGASIAHLHQHIVPRYGNELGFIDILSGTRIMVVDPSEVMNRLRKRLVP